MIEFRNQLSIAFDLGKLYGDLIVDIDNMATEYNRLKDKIISCMNNSIIDSIDIEDISGELTENPFQSDLIKFENNVRRLKTSLLTFERTLQLILTDESFRSTFDVYYKPVRKKYFDTKFNTILKFRLPLGTYVPHN